MLLATTTPVGLHAAPPAVTIRHMLWDANQRPLYQLCATQFEAKNADVRIRFQHLGWGDYWPALSTGFISATAPDVFTNHIIHFPEFAANGVMVDLLPLMQRDGVRGDIYEPGLLEMWQAPGKQVIQQFGMPTDWDTIALAINLDQVRAAGIDPASLRKLDWNPRDGGSLGRLIARLTVDESGRRGDEAGFDARRVRTFGYQNPGPGGMIGQTEWSHYAVSAGWRYQDKPWDTALRYDDPVLVATLDWLATLPTKGWSATPAALGKLGADAFFLGGRTAIVPSGTWMVGHFQRHARFPHAWLPLPVGPSGQRASMRNGLALSVWSGSKNIEAAWRWVRYVGSRECQARVAEAGVVYPAIKGLGEVAVGVQRSKGVDASAFLDAANGITFAPPLVARAGEIHDLMLTAMERVLSGRARAAEALPEANRRARAVAVEP